MRYFLMHKDIVVAELVLDEATGSIQRIENVLAADHLPVAVHIRKGLADRAELNAWWIDRSIPASRSGVRKALETLNIPNTQMLLTKCYGLSLSDQYWIKPEETSVSWKEINFFDNPFSEDIGDVLLGKATKQTGFDFDSPDNTSDGCLKKRWKIIDGKRCLIKAGSNPFQQQPFNEVIATRIAQRLGIPHVPYRILWDDGVPYSVCEDFVTPETELVSAWRIMQTQKKENNTSVYRHYLNCCKALGIKDMAHAVDQMIVLDYLLANEDRHQNNFGLLRNADTLAWIGAAPIYDSGTSLGYDKLPSQILSGRDVECKPFKRWHEEQILLVTSFDWIIFDRLKGLDEEIHSVFDAAGEYMDDQRKHAISSAVIKRIEHLQTLAQEQRPALDNTADDIDEDAAKSYDMIL